MSPRGSAPESLDVSVRSDAKFFASERKDNDNLQVNDRFAKLNKGKITEVEENDLELEGGASDIKKLVKNEVEKPLNIKSAHFEVTKNKVIEAFDIMNILRANLDSKNFINEFLSQDQLVMLG